MVATKLMTIQELAALSADDRFYELIDGELIEMSPAGSTHMLVVSRLLESLILYASSRTGIRVLSGDGGYILSRNPDTVLVPDITLVTNDQVRSISAVGDQFAMTPPTIAIEVKSPSDREAQIARKLAKYLSAGVQEVWWVRPRERQISLHRPDRAPEIIEHGETLVGGDFLPGFEPPLSELFGD